MERVSCEPGNRENGWTWRRKVRFYRRRDDDDDDDDDDYDEDDDDDDDDDEYDNDECELEIIDKEEQKSNEIK